MVSKMFRLLVVLSALLLVCLGLWISATKDTFREVHERGLVTHREWKAAADQCIGDRIALRECHALFGDGVEATSEDSETVKKAMLLNANNLKSHAQWMEASSDNWFAVKFSAVAVAVCIALWLLFFVIRFAFTGTIRPLFPWSLRGAKGDLAK